MSHSLFQQLQTKKSNFQLKNKLNQTARAWFEKNHFLETETPILSHFSSLERYLDPLETLIRDDYDQSFLNFLRVSPELSLKKMIASGYEKIFEIGKCFRNGENFSSHQHLHEFNLLEWYQIDLDLEGMMDQWIDLIRYLLEHVQGSHLLSYQNTEYDLTAWQKISVRDAFKNYAQIDFDDLTDWEELIPIAMEKIKRKGISITGNQTSLSLDDAFYWVFLEEIEPKIKKQPTIVFHYPEFQSSFSKLIPDTQSSKFYGLRFEAYLGGLEIANAFEELSDPLEQKKRWEESRHSIQQQKPDQDCLMDQDFLQALARIQERKILFSGIAVGWDRILMLLADESNIRKVTF